jgi:hypothetical protein
VFDEDGGEYSEEDDVNEIVEIVWADIISSVAWSEVSQAWTLQYDHTASKTMIAEGN